MSAPQLPPGTFVAQKYQVGALLGYGGSSATYQAAGSDGREVVLKMFDPGIRQRADIMGAIEQTYAATNALPQDVAVPLLDAGYDPGTGAPFSVGERIPFPNLAQLVAQRPLTPEEVLTVVNSLAILLDQAHGRQLFHHALKPTNVFVGFAQGYGVRITDFGAGLARAAVPTAEGYAQSAPWIAPEQVQGTVPAGAPADVFSTGLMMFFALTGRSYWRGCQGPIDLQGWQRELTSPRTPPSARAMQLGVQLNSAYDGVLGCALSADPGQRYRTVQELAQAFEGVAGAGVSESQATMAFPAAALGFNMDGGAYPPPPQPSGGYQPAPPAAGGYAGGHPQPQGAGYGAPPSPYGGVPTPPPSQQGMQAPAQLGTAQYPWGAEAPPQQGPPMQPAAAGADAQFGETAAGRPIDPAALQRRASPNRLAPILVALVALLLLGGAAAAWVVMGKKSHPDEALAASSSASASAASADVAPPGSAAPASAAPADSAAAPADTAPTASAAADADAGPPVVHSTLACEPDCDEIRLDDAPIELGQPVDSGARQAHGGRVEERVRHLQGVLQGEGRREGGEDLQARPQADGARGAPSHRADRAGEAVRQVPQALQVTPVSADW